MTSIDVRPIVVDIKNWCWHHNGAENSHTITDCNGNKHRVNYQTFYDLIAFESEYKSNGMRRIIHVYPLQEYRPYVFDPEPIKERVKELNKKLLLI